MTDKEQIKILPEYIYENIARNENYFASSRRIAVLNNELSKGKHSVPMTEADIAKIRLKIFNSIKREKVKSIKIGVVSTLPEGMKRFKSSRMFFTSFNSRNLIELSSILSVEEFSSHVESRALIESKDLIESTKEDNLITGFLFVKVKDMYMYFGINVKDIDIKRKTIYTGNFFDIMNLKTNTILSIAINKLLEMQYEKEEDILKSISDFICTFSKKRKKAPSLQAEIEEAMEDIKRLSQENNNINKSLVYYISTTIRENLKRKAEIYNQGLFSLDYYIANFMLTEKNDTQKKGNFLTVYHTYIPKSNRPLEFCYCVKILKNEHTEEIFDELNSEIHIPQPEINMDGEADPSKVVMSMHVTIENKIAKINGIKFYTDKTEVKKDNYESSEDLLIDIATKLKSDKKIRAIAGIFHSGIIKLKSIIERNVFIIIPDILDINTIKQLNNKQISDLQFLTLILNELPSDSCIKKLGSELNKKLLFDNTENFKEIATEIATQIMNEGNFRQDIYFQIFGRTIVCLYSEEGLEININQDLYTESPESPPVLTSTPNPLPLHFRKVIF
jgi:hypothetical protein